MERLVMDMGSLFAQLGKASDGDAIRQFIELNGPMGDDVLLHDAACWTVAQANFLSEAIQEDAEWAEVVDALNSEMHSRRLLC